MTTNEMVCAHLVYTRRVVNSFLARMPWLKHERDDLHSLGLLGLTEAANTYRPDKGEFKSHAFCAIRRTVMDYVRREGKQAKCGEQLEFVPDRRGNKSFADFMMDGRAVLGRKAFAILCQRFLENRSLDELARDHNVTKGRVSQWITAWLEKCRQAA